MGLKRIVGDLLVCSSASALFAIFTNDAYRAWNPQKIPQAVREAYSIRAEMAMLDERLGGNGDVLPEYKSLRTKLKKLTSDQSVYQGLIETDATIDGLEHRLRVLPYINLALLGIFATGLNFKLSDERDEAAGRLRRQQLF